MASLTIPTWTLTDRMVKARRSAGLEQTDLAEALGVNRATIGRWELGHHAPKRGHLAAWALRCDVPMAWLEHGTEVELSDDRDSDPEGGGTQPTRSPAWVTGDRGTIVQFPSRPSDTYPQAA